MAVPKRKTSKAKKRARRTHDKLGVKGVSYDSLLGTFKRSHFIDPNGEYKGRKVLEKN
ncbi:50S ribosomal protein L32 [Fundicoccus culcitae]|uniref:Large ribosomal subunit protein bL32 n=1 Tax=Fundicoccus culcitae TaxID=2969821 RepID=A0ABY5P8C9_9LACT|nr:50S ribosomal protein L32 [Fundicoccus culcitae]UUX34924.1 50S ribosomal protein L32 [Fundicoccus culcitae]